MKQFPYWVFFFVLFLIPTLSRAQSSIEWNGVTYQPMPLPQYHPPVNNVPNLPIQYHSADQTVEIITDSTATMTYTEISGYAPPQQEQGYTEIDLSQGRNFSNLSLVTNTQNYPWSANVKIFMTFPSGASFVCSGSMIDSKHVLTAGHCVYDADEGGWAAEVTVAPGFNDYETPFGPRIASTWGSWLGWTQNEDYNWDMAYIELTQPVGALTGWLGMSYNTSNSFYTNNTFNNAGYPAAGPYDGSFQYHWSGNYDYVVDQVLFHNNVGYGGQSGSNTYQVNASDERYVHSVLSHGNDAVPYTGHVRINAAKLNDIIGFMNDHTPSVYDLTPLRTLVEPAGTIAAGTNLTDLRFLVHNYSSASFSGNVSVSVYLSNNSTISDQDVLIGNVNYNNINLGSKSSLIFFVSNNLPLIPANTLAGDYYIGVILNVNDADIDNNFTWGWDAAAITVTAPALLPDPYEVNNTENTAYQLPANFSSNAITVQTPGANLHLAADQDYYKVVLPSGYNYVINARVHDSYDSNNGQTYSTDVKFYTKTNTGSWSSSFDTQADEIVLPNGGTVYFRVEVFSGTQTGTYLLDIGINRSINATLSVNPTSLSLNAPSGTTSFTINSNCTNWTITNIPGWMTVSPTSGSGNQTVNIQYQANTATQSRNATLTVSGCNMSPSVAITQAGAQSTLMVSPPSLNFDALSGTSSFSISSNCTNWTITNIPAWMTVSPTSGSGNQTVSIQYQANTATQSRNATLTVSGCNMSPSVAITQAGAQSTLMVSPPSLNFDALSGTSSFSISSNCTSWNITNIPGWMTVSPTSGSGNQTVSIQYESNTATQSRNATLTVSGCSLSPSVAITQAGQPVEYPWTPSFTEDNHTIIIPANLSAAIDGIAIEPGDLIGFFYEDGGTLHCSNFVVWEGSATTCAAYGAEAGVDKNGFSAGELFKVKIYRTATGEEFNAQAQYAPVGTAGIVSHTNAYADDGISMLTTISATSATTLNIPLSEGWNLISSYVMPNQPDMTDVLTPIADQVIILKNGAGQSAIPALGINGVGNWSLPAGYQVKANANTVLTITGAKADPTTTPISIMPGWQIISYLRDQPGPAAVQLAGIADHIQVVKNNAGQAYIPEFGINNIGNLLPTQGYKLKASANATLYYPANLTDNDPEGVLQSRTWTAENVYFILDSAFNTGNNATLVFPAAVVSQMLSEGDEVGVFNAGGILCGAGVFDGDNFAITVWGDDASTEESEGMLPAEVYRFRIWQSENNTEMPANVQFVSGSSSYVEDDLAVVGGLQLDPVRTTNVSKQLTIKYYPNPATTNLQVEINGLTSPITSLTLVSAHGQAVTQFDVSQCPGGEICFLNLRLPPLPEGVYLLRVFTEMNVQECKIMIMNP